MPTISIIIPNYNHAPYLKERIDSVLNQTYQDFEVIILDDKSTDNSKDVIEQYRNHPKISHIIYNKVNSGSTFKQWEKGIELATGEWIWIAESDDFCELYFLSELMEIATKYLSAGLIYCQSYFYHSDSNRLVPQNNFHYNLKLYKGRDFLQSQLIPFNLLVNASMAIFKKEFYPKVSDEYTHYKLAGDWIFWAEIGLLTDVAVSGKYLNYFRQHKIKVSSNILRTGNNYNEEISTLKYFRDRLDISDAVFQKALFNHYLRYESVKKSFDPFVKESVERLFFQNFPPGLQKQYYFRKIKKIILSLLPFNPNFK